MFLHGKDLCKNLKGQKPNHICGHALAMNIITTCRCTNKLHISHKLLHTFFPDIGLTVPFKNYANPHSVGNVAMTHIELSSS